MNLETIGKSISGFLVTVISVAIIAVVLSKGAKTSGVIASFFAGLSALVAEAVAPASGGINATGDTNGAITGITVAGGNAFTAPGSVVQGAGTMNSLGGNPFSGMNIPPAGSYDLTPNTGIQLYATPTNGQ